MDFSGFEVKWEPNKINAEKITVLIPSSSIRVKTVINLNKYDKQTQGKLKSLVEHLERAVESPHVVINAQTSFRSEPKLISLQPKQSWLKKLFTRYPQKVENSNEGNNSDNNQPLT